MDIDGWSIQLPAKEQCVDGHLQSGDDRSKGMLSMKWVRTNTRVTALSMLFMKTGGDSPVIISSSTLEPV